MDEFVKILLEALKSEFPEWELPMHNCDGHFFGDITFFGEELGVFRGMIEITDDDFTGEEQIQRIIAEVVEKVGVPVTFEKHSDNRIIMYWLDEAAHEMKSKYESYDEEDDILYGYHGSDDDDDE